MRVRLVLLITLLVLGGIASSLYFVYRPTREVVTNPTENVAAKPPEEAVKGVSDPKDKNASVSTQLIFDLLPRFPGEETIKLEAFNNQDRSVVQIYSKEGSLLLELNDIPFWISISEKYFRVVSLSPDEYAILLTYPGITHYSYSFFMRVIDDGKVLEPINACISGTTVCGFFNSVGVLIAKDLDDDGMLDLASIVDEYPPEGGRGRPVLANVYKYDGNGSFMELTENKEEYEKYFKVLYRPNYTSSTDIYGKKEDYELIRPSESRGQKIQSSEDYWSMIKGRAENKRYYPEGSEGTE